LVTLVIDAFGDHRAQRYHEEGPNGKYDHHIMTTVFWRRRIFLDSALPLQIGNLREQHNNLLLQTPFRTAAGCLVFPNIRRAIHTGATNT
jgi:hypothetical protein